MTATPTETDIQMMHRALEAADRAADMGEVPIGAVVYRNEEILATAHNLRETNNDPTAHAEIIALQLAAQKIGHWRLIDCSIAVTLEPCPMCAGALVNARVARLVYGADDPKMGCVRTLANLCEEPRFNHRLEVIPNVLAQPAIDKLQAFFRARR
ncbi:tRNA adenosine(34) deaminase TadA [Mucisphaera sp.]|uniref:tRNA adenosine(34) deaminase TadA n=1 Tax=Mucisphaera sp. TaxID=2913024 RepID=UPI003D0AB831